MHHKSSKIRFLMLTLVLAALLLAPLGATAAPFQVGLADPASTAPIPYSEIGPKLQEIADASKRVRFEVIGQSAGGLDMYLVTLTDPKSMGRLGHYQAIRNLMLKDPEKAQELLEKGADFKVPFFINASIHGDEKPGVDAAIKLIETLAYEENDTDEVHAILDNVILLVNVVANPDGRVANTRSNANGFDLNRDFITQSQPETRAMVKVITEWNPMVLLDLHGFYNPMLIEPCTPLHNPNYEYDLYIQWAYYEALAMEEELLAQTGFSAQIPFRDDPSGWDDWAPTYTPMYAMFHGAYGHTLETPFHDERGVNAHYAASWGALKFVAENREDMIYDQIEIFRRGFLDIPQMLDPDEPWWELTDHEQFLELTLKTFPTAYIIPNVSPPQLSSHQPARLVNFLLANDVQVEKATENFTYAGENYLKGTYIVWMDQPKRGLANTILESGPDLSGLEGISFYSPPSVWSNLLLWGSFGVVIEEDLIVETIPIKQADPLDGSLSGQGSAYYAYQPVNLIAFRATNDLLDRKKTVYRSEDSFILEDADEAEGLAENYDLKVFALDELPDGAVELTKPRIAVYADPGTAHALTSMDFEFDQFSQSDLNTGRLVDYDVFVNLSASWNSLNKFGQNAFYAFITNGGDYIGLKGGGVDFAIGAGIIVAEVDNGSGNAIVKVEYSGDTVSAGFREQDYAFVYTPVWFTDSSGNYNVSATLGWEEDVNHFLVSGYWPGWMESEAGGEAVVIHTSPNDHSMVTLIGLDTTFRGHPENTFRLIGNAIFSGMGSE